MMTAIFYAMIALLVAYEFIILLDIERYIDKIIRLKGLTKGEATTKDSIKALGILGAGLFTYLVILIGLFSSQWLAFVLFLGYTLLMTIVYKFVKKLKSREPYYIVGLIDAFICFGFWLFLIVNHYHLKINVLNLF